MQKRESEGASKPASASKAERKDIVIVGSPAFSIQSSSEEREYKQKRDRENKRPGVLLIATFVVSIVAACAAIYAGTQTERQADIAKDQELRSLRAYVMIKRAIFINVLPDKVPKTDITLENLGQTPVYDLTWKSGIALIEHDKAPLIERATYESCASIIDARDAHHQLMGRDTIITKTSETKLSEAEASLINEGKWGVIYGGRVCYRDIYKIVRTTDFCFFYHKIEDGFVEEVCEIAHPATD